jgi:ribosome-binding protein aMBF1 (putative translation factor)
MTREADRSVRIPYRQPNRKVGRQVLLRRTTLGGTLAARITAYQLDSMLCRLPDVVKQARRHAGLSRVAASKEMRVSESALHRLEDGFSVNMYSVQRVVKWLTAVERKGITCTCLWAKNEHDTDCEYAA